MNSRAVWLVRIFCLWTFFVWGVLIKNMIVDEEHALSFRLVHIGLALISIVLAACVWPLAKRLGSTSSSAS